MSNILEEVKNKRASINTVYYCLFQYYFGQKNRAQLAKDFKKHPTTISNWITRYEKDGFMSRKDRERVYRSFPSEKRKWIVNLYQEEPTLYLSEAKYRFEHNFQQNISIASISRILHVEGLSYKTIERRAMQISESDIIRFFNEMHMIEWDLSSLLFLDEVSIDNRDLWRTHGYGFVGEKIVFRGEFNRKTRVSMLCFINQSGLVDYFTTDGTFTRLKFFECCRELALSGKIKQHPGKNSVWIMDGAVIHRDPGIIMYLRSLGIIPLFLPAYCAFFNPIEVMFGLLKKFLTKHYEEKKSKNMQLIVLQGLAHFVSYDFTAIFGKCGYISSGRFDPTKGLSGDKKFVGCNN